MNVNVETDVNVDLVDLLEDLNINDIDEVIKYLIDEGHIAESEGPVGEQSPLDMEWSDQVVKLLSNRTNLTVAEEETILSITRKFV